MPVFTTNIPRSLVPGDRIEIGGKIKENARKMSINLCAEDGEEPRDVVLHYDVRFHKDNIISLSRKNGIWIGSGNYDTNYNMFVPGTHFKIVFEIRDADVITIYCQGKFHSNFLPKIPLSLARYLVAWSDIERISHCLFFLKGTVSEAGGTKAQMLMSPRASAPNPSSPRLLPSGDTVRRCWESIPGRVESARCLANLSTSLVASGTLLRGLLASAYTQIYPKTAPRRVRPEIKKTVDSQSTSSDQEGSGKCDNFYEASARSASQSKVRSSDGGGTKSSAKESVRLQKKEREKVEKQEEEKQEDGDRERVEDEPTYQSDSDSSSDSAATQMKHVEDSQAEMSETQCSKRTSRTRHRKFPFSHVVSFMGKARRNRYMDA